MLLEAGLVKEIRAKTGAPIWRRDDESGQTYALKLTAAGAKAIAVDEATASESMGNSARTIQSPSIRSPSPFQRASITRASGTLTTYVNGVQTAQQTGHSNSAASASMQLGEYSFDGLQLAQDRRGSQGCGGAGSGQGRGQARGGRQAQALLSEAEHPSYDAAAYLGFETVPVTVITDPLPVILTL